MEPVASPSGPLISSPDAVGDAALLSAHGWLKLRVAAEPKLKLMPLCEMSVGSRSWQSQCRGHTRTASDAVVVHA